MQPVNIIMYLCGSSFDTNIIITIGNFIYFLCLSSTILYAIMQYTIYYSMSKTV